jgi:hypothetical protein
MRLCYSLVFGLLFLSSPAAADVVTLTPIKDNTLYEDPAGNLSNGAGDHLFAGRTQDAQVIRRGLLAFKVAGSLPSGSTIKSVTLTLNMSWTSSAAHDVTLHRVLANWGEGTSDAAGREGMGAASTSRHTAGQPVWLLQLGVYGRDGGRRPALARRAEHELWLADQR